LESLVTLLLEIAFAALANFGFRPVVQCLFKQAWLVDFASGFGLVEFAWSLNLKPGTSHLAKLARSFNLKPPVGHLLKHKIELAVKGDLEKCGPVQHRLHKVTWPVGAKSVGSALVEFAWSFNLEPSVGHLLKRLRVGGEKKIRGSWPTCKRLVETAWLFGNKAIASLLVKIAGRFCLLPLFGRLVKIAWSLDVIAWLGAIKIARPVWLLAVGLGLAKVLRTLNVFTWLGLVKASRRFHLNPIAFYLLKIAWLVLERWAVFENVAKVTWPRNLVSRLRLLKIARPVHLFTWWIGLIAIHVLKRVFCLEVIQSSHYVASIFIAFLLFPLRKRSVTRFPSI
jgi:hypothetical protein